MKIETDFRWNRWCFGYWRMGSLGPMSAHVIYLGPIAIRIKVITNE